MIASINTARNRAAHHEHLFDTAGGSTATRDACDECVRLLGMLQPEVARSIYGEPMISSVERFIEENPAPCPVRA